MSDSSKFSAANLFDVKGLVCLVTGGGTGIGLMCAQALITGGAKVYITGRREDVLKKTVEEHSKGVDGELIALPGDVTSKESIKNLVKELEGKEDHLDLLINNAGVAGPSFNQNAKTAEELGNTLFETDYDEAMELFQINVLGYFYCSAAFLPLLSKSSSQPQILNILSNASFGRQAMAGMLYSMSKASSIQLTKMLSTHLSPISKVVCNAIAPGLFPSELTASGSDGKNESHLSQDDVSGIPIPDTMGPRAGTAEEMAAAVLYMASKRQQYSNGSILLIDGGVLTQMPSTY